MSLTIVADQNIPLLDHYFGATGDIIKIDGRTLSQAQLINADVLLVRSVTRVNEALLAATPVRFVGSASAGKDHLDTHYLEQTGIAWCHAPGCNADAVADYVLSAFCRTPALLARLFNGALVGIVGIGHVGSCLYRRLQALGIRCIAYDPLIEQNRYPILTDLEQVLTADVVCLHAPLTTTGCYPSYHLLDNARLAQLRPGTVLLNAGRGALIDNQALCKRLIQHADLTVILDVWEGEPAINTTLMQQIHLATPHIAGHSIEGKLMATAMLYQAYCRAFDLTITRFAPSSAAKRHHY